MRDELYSPQGSVELSTSVSPVNLDFYTVPAHYEALEENAVYTPSRREALVATLRDRGA